MALAVSKCWSAEHPLDATGASRPGCTSEAERGRARAGSERSRGGIREQERTHALLRRSEHVAIEVRHVCKHAGAAPSEVGDAMQRTLRSELPSLDVACNRANLPWHHRERGGQGGQEGRGGQERGEGEARGDGRSGEEHAQCHTLMLQRLREGHMDAMKRRPTPCAGCRRRSQRRCSCGDLRGRAGGRREGDALEVWRMGGARERRQMPWWVARSLGPSAKNQRASSAALARVSTELQPLLADVHRGHYDIMRHGPQRNGGASPHGRRSARLRSLRVAPLRPRGEPSGEGWLGTLINCEVGAVGRYAPREHGLYTAPQPKGAVCFPNTTKRDDWRGKLRRCDEMLPTLDVPHLHDGLHRVDRKHQAVLCDSSHGASDRVLREQNGKR
eukprot:6185563-Pleurochrysis_carterae.AAC.2